MSLDATRWAWEKQIKPASTKLVLLALADRADENHCCYPSVSRLAADTCLDRKTIMAAISSLESSGLLSVSRAFGASNKYQLIDVPDRHQTSTKKGTGSKTFPAKKDSKSSTEIGTATDGENGETSTAFGTSPENGTSPEIGTIPVPKTGLGPVPKTGHKPTNESTKNQPGGSVVVKKPKKRAANNFGFQDFLTACREQGERPIPEDDPIYDYADRIGLPAEFVGLAWQWFKRMWADKQQVGINGWRQTFRNAVQGCWPKFWFQAEDGSWQLNTAGKQALADYNSQRIAA